MMKSPLVVDYFSDVLCVWAWIAQQRIDVLEQQQDISGSASWVMNNGRQKLYGNVGYHVLHANVEGLLSNYGEEASWC